MDRQTDRWMINRKKIVMRLSQCQLFVRFVFFCLDNSSSKAGDITVENGFPALGPLPVLQTPVLFMDTCFSVLVRLSKCVLFCFFQMIQCQGVLKIWWHWLKLSAYWNKKGLKDDGERKISSLYDLRASNNPFLYCIKDVLDHLKGDVIPSYRVYT